MINLLDEITEIPFDVFWDKYQEIKPGIYSRDRAEKQWFYMKEKNRVMAFECLARGHPGIAIFHEPYQLLEYFDLPF
jgi:hypothetical protein